MELSAVLVKRQMRHIAIRHRCLHLLEDMVQEYYLALANLPDDTPPALACVKCRRRVFDAVIRSPAYRESYCGAKKHFSIESILTRPDADDILPFYTPPRSFPWESEYDAAFLLTESGLLESERMDIERHVMDGLSESRAGAMRGVSRGVARYSINKAMKKLRKKAGISLMERRH